MASSRSWVVGRTKAGAQTSLLRVLAFPLPGLRLSAGNMFSRRT